jgi:hypothetical protein
LETGEKRDLYSGFYAEETYTHPRDKNVCNFVGICSNEMFLKQCFLNNKTIYSFKNYKDYIN